MSIAFTGPEECAPCGVAQAYSCDAGMDCFVL